MNPCKPSSSSLTFTYREDDGQDNDEEDDGEDDATDHLLLQRLLHVLPCLHQLQPPLLGLGLRLEYIVLYPAHHVALLPDQ